MDVGSGVAILAFALQNPQIPTKEIFIRVTATRIRQAAGPASGNAAKGGGGSSPGMFIPQDRAHPCPRAGRGGAMPHYRIEFIPAR